MGSICVIKNSISSLILFYFFPLTVFISGFGEWWTNFYSIKAKSRKGKRIIDYTLNGNFSLSTHKHMCVCVSVYVSFFHSVFACQLNWFPLNLQWFYAHFWINIVLLWPSELWLYMTFQLKCQMFFIQLMLTFLDITFFLQNWENNAYISYIF